ncbi:hypothetical protein K7W42_18630 [Deinococcus sp. HMF7604]|uniref:hypothetical protein n=1 Tax=Deinococcus betulae TaxID=2873312 RepID=UPI001CCC4EC8|nr:hypothetical protein [Deinococcus betulae]MBZ9752860.1 hypothetical protein [Deinococcus betulae]
MTGALTPAALTVTFTNRARESIFGQLGDAMRTLRFISPAARWPLIEALLAYLPPVTPEQASIPLMGMTAHLDALERFLRGQPSSPAFPDAPQAAARAYLQRLQGPTVADLPITPLLSSLRELDGELDLDETALQLAQTRRTVAAYREAKLILTLYALSQAARAADQLAQERGVHVPWEAAAGELAELRTRPITSREFEALLLLETTLKTAEAVRQGVATLHTWKRLARAAIRAGLARSPLPWVDGWMIPE